MEELLIKSSIDGTMQPSLFYFAGEDKPLVIGLHTWSFDRYNQVENMLPYAKKYGWNLLLPDFRGKNKAENPNPVDACGSLKAKQDVIDAIQFVEEKYNTDSNNRFVIGGSGGGHMALLMAGYRPEMFKCVVSYVPITDISDWYYEKKADSSKFKGYSDDLYVCTGNKTPEEAPDEYAFRSPMSYIDEIAKTTVKICHGKYDPSVPVTHSLKFFLEMQKRHPESKTFLEIFDGGHQIKLAEAFEWVESCVSGNVELTEVTS